MIVGKNSIKIKIKDFFPCRSRLTLGQKFVFKEILPPCGTCRYLYSSYAIGLTRVTLKISELLMPTHHACVHVCTVRVILVYNDSSDLLSVVLEEPGGVGVDIISDPGGRLAYVFHTT